MADCNEAIRLDPGSADVLNCRANVHEPTQPLRRALRDLNAAAVAEPTYPRTYSQSGRRAISTMNAPRTPCATAKSKAMQLQPDDFMAPHLRGRAYFAMRKYEQAEMSFGLAIEKSSGYGWAYYRRALDLDACKKSMRSCSAIATSCSSRNTSPKFVLYERAECHLALKHYEETVRDCEAVLKIEPRHANALRCSRVAQAEIK